MSYQDQRDTANVQMFMEDLNEFYRTENLNIDPRLRAQKQNELLNRIKELDNYYLRGYEETLNPDLKKQQYQPQAPFDFGQYFPGNSQPYNEVDPNAKQYSRFNRPEGRNSSQNERYFYNSIPPLDGCLFDNDSSQFHKYQLMMMNHDPEGVDPRMGENLRKNIALLGGLEDTVGVMEDTLQMNEIQSLHEQYINFYKIEQPIKTTVPEPAYNPFQFHPRDRIIQKEEVQLNRSSTIYPLQATLRMNEKINPDIANHYQTFTEKVTENNFNNTQVRSEILERSQVMRQQKEKEIYKK